MTFSQAEKAFKKQYPKRTIMSAADVDRNRYAVLAQEDPNKEDWADPTFFIDKNTGKVSRVNSTLDEIMLLNDAFEHRKIK